MTQKEFRYKNWFVKYTREDGGRLDQLSYDGFDLLTTRSADFKSPDNDYGEYENRPVYGYDDCFPSVTECPYPESDWVVPDHGEVCWLPFKVEEETNGLLFSVKSQKLPLILKRKLHFTEYTLSWIFEVQSHGSETLPFQHVIHPLMPLNAVDGIESPGFESVFDDIQKRDLPLKSPDQLEKHLLNQPIGTANMLFLRSVEQGSLSIKFKGGPKLKMNFPHDLFPSIGIWWNNNGYPDEDGIRRNECAFEPVPGSNSSLEDAHKERSCLSVASGQQTSWRINWEIIKNY